ncbi:hypothetical protein BGW80DRAFT_1288464 [Lactifluus volemus]|nr:hypothetical protein BGW80DRAFT_1288464 [Lactifluus volemus]
MPLQDVAGHAVRLTDVVQRQYIWLGLMREMLRHTSKILPRVTNSCFLFHFKQCRPAQ